jgi:hypothetical protein
MEAPMTLITRSDDERLKDGATDIFGYPIARDVLRDSLRAMLKRLEALRARIEVLEKAAEYAEHHPNCGYTFDHVTQTGEMVGCTCGLSAALDALKEG